MTAREMFIEEVEKVVENFPEEAQNYFETFKETVSENKKEFTENGKIILACLKDNLDITMWKAKDIADKIELSSRTVSGALRKLVSDGYVEKTGKNPVIYNITEKGKNIEF